MVVSHLCSKLVCFYAGREVVVMGVPCGVSSPSVAQINPQSAAALVLW